MAHHRHHMNHKQEPRLDGVAPAHLLREDYTILDAKTVLRCTDDVEQLLLMQSIEGHAHAGHGLFYGSKYPNTTVDDVARSLRLDPMAVKRDRQILIDEVLEFAQRVVNGESINAACNAEGEPLMRCGTLRQIDIEPIGVLRGLYAGGLRDDAVIRELANKRYEVEMGYGECRLVDQRVLRSLGLDGYGLSQGSHEAQIPEFEKQGLFAENGDSNVAYMYVRYKVGPGASDDAAIVMAGKMFGLSGAVGCFLADAVDTLEKYVPVYFDQDSGISEWIGEHVPDLGLTQDDAVDLACLCAIQRDMQGDLPDSSLRHMLQIERKCDQSTLESHLAYVAGRPYTPMVLDHGECTNVEFYDYCDKKFSQFEKKR